MQDDVVACKGVKAKIRKVEVMKDYDSRPHKLEVWVLCKNEPQEVRNLKIPKPLPGVSGGKVLMLENGEQN